jgi:hypothetical protein
LPARAQRYKGQGREDREIFTTAVATSVALGQTTFLQVLLVIRFGAVKRRRSHDLGDNGLLKTA